VSSTAGSPLVVLLTTLAAETDGAAFARTLVDERLAACVNVLAPMTSVYRWKDAIEQAQEQQLLIKTTAERIPAVQERFRSLHPYELPEFIVMRPSDAAELYVRWVKEAVT
jgi:periplasmic divalent cation tolerance protein